MDTLNAESTKQLLTEIANAILSSKDYLTKVDQAIGDGDHGVGMEVGMKAALKKIGALDTEDPYQVFAAFGKAMLMSMGGASGVIFGNMFSAGAKKMPPSREITPEGFAKMFSLSLADIKSRGGAQPGDKTMIDAFEPAVCAMLDHQSEAFGTMIMEAYDAAAAGAEKTKDYIANFGRAKSLRERALGHPDAGAVSTAIIFSAMKSFFCN